MPKSREAEKGPTNCSFCGRHKDDVPFAIVSTQTKACICAWCGLATVEQAFSHMTKLDDMVRQQVMTARKARAEEENPKPKIVTSDKVGEAIKKATNGK